MLLSGGDRLLAMPAVLALAAFISYLQPSSSRLRSRIVALIALILAGVCGLSLLPSAIAGGNTEISLGQSIPGVEILFSADAVGLTVALGAILAAILSLGESQRRPGEEPAILLCVLGSVIAALSGNLILLFGGVEIGNAGFVLLLTSGRSRFTRGTVLAFVLQHTAAVALLAVAAELQMFAGSTNPNALPSGSIDASLAWLWAVAGAIPLLSLAFAPGAGDRRSSRTWYSVSSIPLGTVILLRLLETTGVSLPADATILLAVAGCAVAISGALVAWNFSSNHLVAGRGLLAAFSGMTVAVAGQPGAGGAFAACALALYLAAIVAPGWAHTGKNFLSRISSAAGLLVAGGLPVGFGTSALALVFATLSLDGKGAGVEAAVLMASALVSAAAAVRSAYWLMTAEESQTSQRIRIDALLALGASFLFGVVPGLTAARVVGWLGFRYSQSDWFVIQGAAGSWAGGYFMLTLIFIVVLLMAIFELMQWKIFGTPNQASISTARTPVWSAWLGPRRKIGPVLRNGLPAIRNADRWMAYQPQLGFVVIAALAALAIFK